MTPAEFRDLRTRAGGPSAVARALGISRKHLWAMETGSREIRPVYILAIESLARPVAAPPRDPSDHAGE